MVPPGALGSRSPKPGSDAVTRLALHTVKSDVQRRGSSALQWCVDSPLASFAPVVTLETLIIGSSLNKKDKEVIPTGLYVLSQLAHFIVIRVPPPKS